MTKAEHREAHRERAGKLLETMIALTPSSLNFRTFGAEYHTAAQLLEEMGHG
jgi:hypothetical protein